MEYCSLPATSPGMVFPWKIKLENAQEVGPLWLQASKGWTPELPIHRSWTGSVSLLGGLQPAWQLASITRKLKRQDLQMCLNKDLFCNQGNRETIWLLYLPVQWTGRQKQSPSGSALYAHRQESSSPPPFSLHIRLTPPRRTFSIWTLYFYIDIFHMASF